MSSCCSTLCHSIVDYCFVTPFNALIHPCKTAEDTWKGFKEDKLKTLLKVAAFAVIFGLIGAGIGAAIGSGFGLGALVIGAVAAGGVALIVNGVNAFLYVSQNNLKHREELYDQA